jgi:hypothetical protein
MSANSVARLALTGLLGGHVTARSAGQPPIPVADLVLGVDTDELRQPSRVVSR